MSHDALLRAVLDNPDDDTPRLVYADWLEEHGDPARAAFIRVQCDLARLPDDDPHRPGLEDREHELLGEYESNWVSVIRELAEWEFKRGFLDSVTTRSSHFPETVAQGHPVTTWSILADSYTDSDQSASAMWLVEDFPDVKTVRHIDVTSWIYPIHAYAEVMDYLALAGIRGLDFASLPGLSALSAVLARSTIRKQLRRVAFGGRSGRNFQWADAANETLDVPSFVAALADAPLEHLTAFDCGLTAGGLQQLLAAPLAEYLKELDVSDNRIAADGHYAFQLAHPGLRLRKLDLSHTGLGAISLELILAGRPLENLESLLINGCGSANWNLSAIARSAYWTRATELRARGGTIPAHLFEPLARAAGSPRLRTLDLGNNYLRTAGVRMLCDAPWAGGLTYLDLSENYLDDESLTAVADSGRLTKLRTLHLVGNNFDQDQSDGEVVTDAGVRRLADSPGLGRLRLLNLGHTGVTDRSVDVVLNAPHWRLSGLGLDGCDLSPAAVRTLADSPRLARLSLLHLRNNPRLSGDALRPLAESPHLSRLCELDIRGVYVSEKTRQALRERLGPRLSE